MAIDAAVRRVHVITLFGCAWFGWRRDFSRIRVNVWLQTGKGQIRICHESKPRHAERSKYSKKQFHELIQATLTSGTDSFDDSAAGSCGRTRNGSSRISFIAVAKLTLATKMSRTATFCIRRKGWSRSLTSSIATFGSGRATPGIAPPMTKSKLKSPSPTTLNHRWLLISHGYCQSR